jgi:hypothetical protein
MNFRIALMSMAMLLSGCSLETIAQRRVTGATARIRIDDGLPIRVYPGQICHKKSAWGRGEDPKPYSSPETYTAVYKVVKTSTPLHLGMPVTPATPPLYNEYYIEANSPVMVSVFYATGVPGYKNAPTVTTSCGPIYTTFMPEAGKDYEVRGVAKGEGLFSQKYCAAEISEVAKMSDGSPFLKPVIRRSAAPCD